MLKGGRRDGVEARGARKQPLKSPPTLSWAPGEGVMRPKTAEIAGAVCGAAALFLLPLVTAGAAAAPQRSGAAAEVVLVQPGEQGQRFRVQSLSSTMVRVEAEGPKGWEDRPTFLVQNRSWGTAVPLRKENAALAVSEFYAVEVDASGQIAVIASSGAALWRGWLANVSAKTPMPQPADNFLLWAVADIPRFAAPAEGPVPGSAASFDLANEADDAYFFVSNPNTTALGRSYTLLRKEFLQLSGHVPLLPDYAFGSMFTWYHNYTAAAKLAEIREFAARGIPLDVASLDMDWRLHPCYNNSLTPNCSATPLATEAQYVPNTALIPDMAGFISAVHALNVSLFFNDHPMQPDPSFAELSPKEIQFRWDGLTSLMDQGLDFWWFDCHWHDLIPGIQCPSKAKKCDGIDYAAWGDCHHHHRYQFYEIKN
eukprot:COSAG05_NODE_2536_length_2932_cov_2.918814_1_plen_426_part_00